MKETSIASVAVVSATLLSLLHFPFRTVASDLRPGRPAAQYSVDFWHESQGLLSSRIRNIVQTRDGYLWLATDGGLVRFDGASFTTFNVRTGSLKDDEVWALKEDKAGGLWIGTFGGGLTLLKDGRYTTFTAADGLPDDVVRQIDEDPQGNIWIATSRGACRYSRGVFTSFTRKDGLSHDYVVNICAGSTQGVFAIAGNKLHCFADGKFVVESGIAEEADGRITSLTRGADASLWIGFERPLVKQLKDGLLTTYPLGNSQSSNSRICYQDRQGNVWLGSSDGLRRLRNGKFEQVPPRDARNSLGVVLSLCEDREGSLWLGMETSGLARLRSTEFNTITDEDGLPDSSTRTVFPDDQGNIWIGTIGGLAMWRNGSITNYTEAEGSHLISVTSIGEDKAGHLWVGAGGELFIMKNGRLAKDRSWKRTPDIKAIYRDSRGRMWVGTDGDGLFGFDDGQISVYRTQDGLASNNVRSILYDRNGALWVATNGGGVSRLADGKFTTYTTKDGLGSNRVVTIHEDEEGALWFGTRGGLSRYRDGRIFTYRAQDGLLVDYVGGIVEDKKGNFWFSCGQGIFSVSKSDMNDFAEGRIKKITPEVYGVEDGVRNVTFAAGNQPNSGRTRDGRLLFCSLRGVTTVDPEHLSSNTFIPPVHIESVLINKQTVRPGDYVEISPGVGEVEIHYTAASFRAPGKVQFKYQLEGFDREWVVAGTRRFAFYANLPAGNYKFRVIACNDDGVWNETGDSFYFYLKPHFYHTGWFYLLSLLALLAIAGAAFQLRVRQLEAHKKELQKRVTEALAKVKILSGMLPICANCKKVRDDTGYWSQIESYIGEHSDTTITHGICPDCFKKLYPEFVDEISPGESAPGF